MNLESLGTCYFSWYTGEKMDSTYFVSGAAASALQEREALRWPELLDRGTPLDTTAVGVIRGLVVNVDIEQ